MKYVYKKRKLVLVGLLAACYNAVTLTFPLALMKITDSIIGGDMNNFWFFISLAVASVLVRVALHILLTWTEQHFLMNCMSKLKCDLLKGILSFDCGFFETSKPSQYSSFMINDLRMLEEH